MTDMGWSGAGWMDPQPMPSAPTPTDEVKAGPRFRCLNCRGTVDAMEYERLRVEGTHTDANGKPDQPNNGIAFCPTPTCHDFTLIEEG